MIFDTIKNKDNYKTFPMLYQALCFLESTSKTNLPLLNTQLLEDKLFCSPVTLTSKPEHECIYEAHHKYIDLHYIISGIERIATADTSSLSITVPYSSNSDIEFLTGPADGYYDLKPGQFMVCFPSDAHKVAIAAGGPCSILKIVFKISVEV